MESEDTNFVFLSAAPLQHAAATLAHNSNPGSTPARAHATGEAASVDSAPARRVAAVALSAQLATLHQPGELQTGTKLVSATGRDGAPLYAVDAPWVSALLNAPANPPKASVSSQLRIPAVQQDVHGDIAVFGEPARDAGESTIATTTTTTHTKAGMPAATVGGVTTTGAAAAASPPPRPPPFGSPMTTEQHAAAPRAGGASIARAAAKRQFRAAAAVASPVLPPAPTTVREPQAAVGDSASAPGSGSAVVPALALPVQRVDAGGGTPVAVAPQVQPASRGLGMEDDDADRIAASNARRGDDAGPGAVGEPSWKRPRVQLQLAAAADDAAAAASLQLTSPVDTVAHAHPDAAAAGAGGVARAPAGASLVALSSIGARRVVPVAGPSRGKAIAAIARSTALKIGAAVGGGHPLATDSAADAVAVAQLQHEGLQHDGHQHDGPQLDVRATTPAPLRRLSTPTASSAHPARSVTWSSELKAAPAGSSLVSEQQQLQQPQQPWLPAERANESAAAPSHAVALWPNPQPQSAHAASGAGLGRGIRSGERQQQHVGALARGHDLSSSVNVDVDVDAGRDGARLHRDRALRSQGASNAVAGEPSVAPTTTFAAVIDATSRLRDSLTATVDRLATAAAAHPLTPSLRDSASELVAAVPRVLAESQAADVAALQLRGADMLRLFSELSGAAVQGLVAAAEDAEARATTLAADLRSAADAAINGAAVRLDAAATAVASVEQLPVRPAAAQKRSPPSAASAAQGESIDAALGRFTQEDAAQAAAAAKAAREAITARGAALLQFVARAESRTREALAVFHRSLNEVVRQLASDVSDADGDSHAAMTLPA